MNGNGDGVVHDVAYGSPVLWSDALECYTADIANVESGLSLRCLGRNV